MLSRFTENNIFKEQEKKQKTLFSFAEGIVLFFLFLAAFNFVNRFAVCVFIAFAAFLLFCGNNIKTNNEIILFLLFSLSLLIFWDQGHSSILAILRMFAYPMCFLLGYNLPQNAEAEKKERAFKAVAIILALGTWAHLMLNFSINYDVEDTARNTEDYWLGSELSATAQATLACLTIAVAVAIMFSKNNILAKLLATATVILALWYNLILAGRSMFILLFAAMAAAIIYYWISSKKFNKLIIAVLCLATVAVACVIIYNNNTFGIKEIIEESNFYDRFFNDTTVEITEDSRGGRKSEYLKYLVDYPFGGGHINEIVDGHAHDLYLDTYDEAGVFACLLIIIIVIRYAVKTFKLVKNKKVSFGTKQLALCLLVTLNIQFWMEPILAGAAWLLSCFCILYGNLCSLVDTFDGIKRTDLL